MGDEPLTTDQVAEIVDSIAEHDRYTVSVSQYGRDWRHDCEGNGAMAREVLRMWARPQASTVMTGDASRIVVAPGGGPDLRWYQVERTAVKAPVIPFIPASLPAIQGPAPAPAEPDPNGYPKLSQCAHCGDVISLAAKGDAWTVGRNGNECPKAPNPDDGPMPGHTPGVILSPPKR